MDRGMVDGDMGRMVWTAFWEIGTLVLGDRHSGRAALVPDLALSPSPRPAQRQRKQYVHAREQEGGGRGRGRGRGRERESGR
eukprot:2921504-Rhodomonas_salina.1